MTGQYKRDSFSQDILILAQIPPPSAFVSGEGVPAGVRQVHETRIADMVSEAK